MCCPQPGRTLWQSNKIPELGDNRNLTVELIKKNVTAKSALVSSFLIRILPFYCRLYLCTEALMGSNIAQILKFHFALNFSDYAFTVISFHSA
jgi:hypothetical protein